MFEMSTEESIRRDRQFLIHGWGYIPIDVVKGEGSRFWDSEGKEYIDMLSQTAGVVGVGHCNPKVVAAVREQADKSMHLLTSFINIPGPSSRRSWPRLPPGG